MLVSVSRLNAVIPVTCEPPHHLASKHCSSFHLYDGCDENSLSTRHIRCTRSQRRCVSCIKFPVWLTADNLIILDGQRYSSRGHSAIASLTDEDNHRKTTRYLILSALWRRQKVTPVLLPRQEFRTNDVFRKGNDILFVAGYTTDGKHC